MIIQSCNLESFYINEHAVDWNCKASTSDGAYDGPNDIVLSKQ